MRISRLDDRAHCLELIEGFDFGRRYIVGPAGASIGRTAPADIVLGDSEVSRAHCRLALDGELLIVTDLNSTNGTFIDGVRISAPTPFPVGAILRVGRQSLKHEWRTQREILQHDEFDRELKKANSYVEALLPPPLTEGPIRTDWLYEPCSRLGGDAFGYGALTDDQFLIYMLDVSRPWRRRGDAQRGGDEPAAPEGLARHRYRPARTGAGGAEPDVPHGRPCRHVFHHVDRGLRPAQPDLALCQRRPSSRPSWSRPTAAQAVALRTRNGLIGVDPGTRLPRRQRAGARRGPLCIFSATGYSKLSQRTA